MQQGTHRISVLGPHARPLDNELFVAQLHTVQTSHRLWAQPTESLDRSMTLNPKSASETGPRKEWKCRLVCPWFTWTYLIGGADVHVLTESVTFGQWCGTVFDKVESFERTEGCQELLNLHKRAGESCQNRGRQEWTQSLHARLSVSNLWEGKSRREMALELCRRWYDKKIKHCAVLTQIWVY